ncbi:hypothetical protein [Haloplanus halobius]|nr:hypothetical protein [Haloplanus sp. XH21]
MWLSPWGFLAALIAVGVGGAWLACEAAWRRGGPLRRFVRDR